MKLRMILATGLLACFALAASAADETKALLEAKRVKDAICVKYGEANVPNATKPEQKIQYAIDDTKTFRELKDTPTLSAKDTIFLRYAEFNPLTRGVAGSEKSEPDPIEKQLADFSAAAATNLGAIFPTAKLGGGLTDSKGDCTIARETCETVAASVQDMTDRVRVADTCRANFTTCVCKAINTSLANLRTDASFYTSQVTEDTLKAWMKKATGQDGVVKTIAAIKDVREPIKTNLEKSFVAYESLRALNAESVSTQCARPPTVKPPNETPAQETARGQVELDDIERAKIGRLADAATANAAGKKLLESLNALITFLEPYETSANWRDGVKGPLTDYEFFASQPTATEKKTLTVSIAEKKLSLKEGAVTHTASTPVESKLVLRYGRRFVPEVGMAVVYNDLRYPKYKVEEFEGQKIVASDGFDTANVQGAVMLNGFLDAGSEFFFPGWQIGVSSAKDYPGLLAGVVFRLNRPQRFSLSTGAIVTWHKDLNKLKVGSPVASAADIEADLKRRRSPTDWYVALQYTF